MTPPSTPTRPLIVGAGIAGAVLARELAERGGIPVLVIDSRSHPAGNCHTERDAETNVMVHVHGPHIFNTNHQDVWDYVQRFGRWRRFRNQVKAVNSRGVFSFPINLHTINQFFGLTLSPQEARDFIAGKADRSIKDPANFEEQALSLIGRELYEAFLMGYTTKQWGMSPDRLPASILKRLPVRFTYDDNYYATRLQAIPEDGYTAMIGRLLDHPLIETRLGCAFARSMADGRHVFFSGPIDAYFDYCHGRLSYRTVYFERSSGLGDLQGNAVLNYTDASVLWTRSHEHKHFAPWETHEHSVLFREYSKATGPGDIPYYPVRLPDDMERLDRYRADASLLPNTTFFGRLGTYRYLDMDQVVGESLDLASVCLDAWKHNAPLPAFGPNRLK